MKRGTAFRNIIARGLALAAMEDEANGLVVMDHGTKSQDIDNWLWRRYGLDLVGAAQPLSRQDRRRHINPEHHDYIMDKSLAFLAKM